jgi:hypothetical protein
MKQPAYARALRDDRRDGVDPISVLVIYGDDWSFPEFRLAVRPKKALGLDWTAVAGLPVDILDRSVDDHTDAAGNCELFFLVGEIAREAATVSIITPEPLMRGLFPDNDSCVTQADLFAFVSRRWDAAARRMRWPEWWPANIDRLNGDNRRRWLEETEKAFASIAA